MPLTKLVLKKDIVIPAGTELSPIPPGSTTTHGEDCFEYTVGITDNNTGSFYCYMDDPDGELDEWFEEVPI